jgi:hypothetical protein
VMYEDYRDQPAVYDLIQRIRAAADVADDQR